MSVSALSSAGFARYISASSDISASQQAFNSLQQNLASGNISGALSAFNSYQKINRVPTSADSSSATSGKQMSNDMAALGSALNHGNLGKARSAFATLQADLKISPSQAIANATAAAKQTVQWIDAMISLTSPYATKSSTSAANLATNILEELHGFTPSSSNPDLATTLLNNAYGAASSPSSSETGTSTDTSDSTSSASGTAATPGYAVHGNLGSSASVNVYA